MPLSLPSTFTVKPRYTQPLRVKQTGLGRKLAFTALFNDFGGGTVSDVVGGITGTRAKIGTGVLPAWVNTYQGQAMNFVRVDASNGGYINLGTGKLDIFATSFTFHFRAMWNALPLTGNPQQIFQSADIALQANGSPNTLSYLGNLNDASTGVIPDITKFHDYTFTWDGTTNWAWYLDGATSGSGTDTAVASTAGDVTFGAVSGTQTQFLNAKVMFIYVWKRVLTAAEVANLTLAPYSMFQGVPLRRWYGTPYVPANPLAQRAPMLAQ